MRIVDNANMRRVVAEFATEPNQRRSLEVLRTCMYGELLLDVTGSEMRDGNPFSAGSQLNIRCGTGPDGGRALFAFTSNEQIGRMYPPNTQTQSLVNPATGVLGLARQQGDAWLYIDPAGPTCAVSAAEIDFALRNPNNEPLKAALAALTPTIGALARYEGLSCHAGAAESPKRVPIRGFAADRHRHFRGNERGVGSLGVGRQHAGARDRRSSPRRTPI